jgi:glycosyltransferase involved in cell wall biosynthesis
MYPYPERPSYGAFVKSQIDSIESLGHEVEVLFINGKRSRWNYARALFKLRCLVGRRRFDIVHAHYGYSGVVALLQRRTPVTISFCGDDLLGTPDRHGDKTLLSRCIVLLGRLAAHFADGIIVKSKQMRDCLLPGDRQRAFVIPNGVDFDQFKPEDRVEARHTLGLDSNRQYVLFPSTPYERRKRVDLAESAIRNLEGEFPDVELLVVYHQPQELLPVYMGACDALVMTSDWEGSSNVVKEAMACNLPVVSVDAGDAWEVIDGSRHCHRTSRDPADVAEKLAAVLRSGGQRSNGRSKVARLELSAVAKSVSRVYALARDRRSCVA